MDFNFVYVVDNFYFFIVSGMVMFANEFKTKKNQKLTEIKN